MKKYWFYLFPGTFIWTKVRDGIVYNSENGESFRFEYAGPLKAIVDELNRIESLYRILVRDEDLMNPEIKSFINSAIGISAGDLLPESNGIKRPISYKPELRVRDDARFYKWRHNNGIGGNVVDNLNGLIFYINGSSCGSDEYYKQAIFPFKSTSTLERDRIEDFTLKCRRSPYLSNVSLVGNIWEYPDYNLLIDNLTRIGTRVTIYCLVGDMLSNLNKIDRLINHYENVSLHTLIDDYGVATDFFQNAGDVDDANMYYSFFCKNEAEYGSAIELTDKFNLQNTDVIPLYVGNNLEFFEDYVYVTEDEILNSKLSKREVLAHQGLNTHFFGKLHIMPDGSIYANCNNSAIGSINDLPYDVIYKEVQEGESWLSIRDKEPCCECVYQWLCPSPSNYELVIGKSNLCNSVTI